MFTTYPRDGLTRPSYKQVDPFMRLCRLFIVNFRLSQALQKLEIDQFLISMEKKALRNFRYDYFIVNVYYFYSVTK